MPTFPLRHMKYANFNAGRRTRYVVAAAFQDRLLVTSRAFEILSVVSGMQLARVQRQALWPTLHELLTDPSLATIGSGPQSQADVLGACVGLAAFALRLAPGSWSFVHIPRGRARSPDIYAVEDLGATWFIELKAVSPSDSEVDAGAELDTCKRVSSQRRTAIRQLVSPTIPAAPGPAIRVVGPLARWPIATGAVAYVVSVIPRAGLASRSDIASPGKPGCPRVAGTPVPCAQRCLDGSYEPTFITCPVVLWGERSNQVPPAAGNLAPRLLGAIRTVNGGLWSGSTPLVGAAIEELARLLTGADEEQRIKLLPAMRDLLRATRLHSTPSSRASLVEALGPLPAEVEVGLHAEALRGVERRPQEREVRRGDLVEVEAVRGIEQVVCELPGGVARGTRTRLGIRLAPDVSAMQSLPRDRLSPERYLRDVLPGEPAFEQEGVRLVERLVEDPEAPHPNPLRAGAKFVLGHSWSGAGKTEGWLTTDGLLELRHTGSGLS